jgi:hypothetical protein
LPIITVSVKGEAHKCVKLFPEANFHGKLHFCFECRPGRVGGGVGERKVTVVQNGKILINGTFTMSFSWRKFVFNLWILRAHHLLSLAHTRTISTHHYRLEYIRTRQKLF